MKQRAPGAWMTINTSYYCGPACDTGELLDDASLFLNGAYGIAQSLSDLLSQGVDINPDDLAKALWGASVLIQMGQRSAEQAHVRIRKIRKGLATPARQAAE